MLPVCTYVHLYRKNRETEINEIELQVGSLGVELKTTTTFLTDFEAARNLKQSTTIKKV